MFSKYPNFFISHFFQMKKNIIIANKITVNMMESILCGRTLYPFNPHNDPMS